MNEPLDQYVHIAYSAAHKIIRNPKHREDILAAALLGLVQGHHTYNPASGSSYTNWLWRNAYWQAVKELQYQKSTPEQYEIQEGDITVPDPADTINSQVDAQRACATALASITSEQRDIVLAVTSGEPIVDIAKRYGKNRRTISYHYHNALKTMRDAVVRSTNP